jgi:hypothetical protein
MQGEQLEIYLSYLAQAKKEAMTEIEGNGFEKSQIKILALLTRLRQICCHPSLFIDNYKGESGKLNQCIEIVKDAIQSGHKILLFSGYTAMFEIIEKEGTGKSYGKKLYFIKTLAPFHSEKEEVQIYSEDGKSNPEEIVRQLYTYKLLEEYGYPAKQIQFEYPIKFGREAKRADIVVVSDKDLSTAYIIAEIKKPKAKDGKEQLKSYCHGTGATMAVWTNGEAINFYHRKNPNFFEAIF